MMMLSGDPPRSRALSVLLIVIIAALAVAPLVFPGAKAMNVATKICIFAALVASYDLLLGYTGSVSFAHTMFYGIGSYAIAIALYSMGPSWTAVATGLAIGLPLAALLALCIGLFSLRVEAIFFAMITLAVASAFLVLASQLSWLTGGEDGRSFQLPELLRPGTILIPKDWFGFAVNGRTLTYYIIFIACAAMILGLLRVVNSPFGRVLQALRENRFRAEALGYRTVFHLTYANCIAALVAASAGALNALWLRYAGPDTSLSFAIMLDILLMVVIGGMGTMYGAIVGAAIFILAQNYLQALMSVASNAAAEAGLPLLPGLLHPDRWLLWLGLLFIFSVYFFPAGIVGRLRAALADPHDTVSRTWCGILHAAPQALWPLRCVRGTRNFSTTERASMSFYDATVPAFLHIQQPLRHSRQGRGALRGEKYPARGAAVGAALPGHAAAEQADPARVRLRGKGLRAGDAQRGAIDARHRKNVCRTAAAAGEDHRICERFQARAVRGRRRPKTSNFPWARTTP